VRIRSLAKLVLFIAIGLCAMSYNDSLSSETLSSLPFNGIQSASNCIQEEPAFSSPISPELMPALGQSEVGKVLWLSLIDDCITLSD
jgi:hypothetical protein